MFTDSIDAGEPATWRQMTTIVLADDHRMVRQGLRGLLEDETDLRVVGEAADGIEAVEITARLRPDILVTDLKMPGLGGIEVTARVRELSPATGIVILSMYGIQVYVDAALSAGARGYVVKKSVADGLIDAVRTVAAGGSYLSPLIARGRSART